MVVHGITKNRTLETRFYTYDEQRELVRFYKDFLQVFWLFSLPENM
jgi:hypothetical protein